MWKTARWIKIADEKELKIKYSLEDAEFRRKMSDSNSAIQAAGRQFKLYATDIENATDNKGKLEAKARTLNTQLTEQKDKVRTLSEQFENVKNREGEFTAESRRLATQLDNAQIQANRFESELAQVNRELALVRSEKIKELGTNIKNAGDKMTAFGKGMTTHVTLPLVAIGGLAVKAAIDVESAFAGVEKTVDAPREALDALKTGFMEMSKEIPVTAVELMGIGEAAGQLGIQTPNILSFTRTMADLGVSTNMSSEQAATSLARLANITGMSQNNFDRLGSVIVALGNNFATTESEITEMGLRLAGAGSQVGMTEHEIMSFAAALSSVGIEAEAGGSAFSKVMVEMQLASETGGESLDNFAKVAGMSSESFAIAFKTNASGAMTSFIKGLSETEKSGVSAIKVLDDMGITEVRMRDALLRAAGASDTFTNALSVGSAAWTGNNALTDEASKRYATTASQLEIFKNKLIEAGVTIGEALLPHLTKAVEFITGLANGFMELDPGMQGFIINVALFVAAAGPIITIAGTAVSGVGMLTTAFGTLTGASALAAVGTAGTGTAIAGASAAGVAGAAGTGLFATALGVLSTVALPVTLAVVGTGLAVWGVHEATKETNTEFSLLNTSLATGVTAHTEYTNAVGVNNIQINTSNQQLATAQEASSESIKKSLVSQKDVVSDYALAYEGLVTTHQTADAYSQASSEKTTIKVSEETLKQIDAYQQLGEDMVGEVTLMWANSEVITDEMASSIIGKVNNMSEQTITALDNQKTESLTSIEELKNSGIGLTDDQYKRMLETVQTNHKLSVEDTRNYQAQITDIMTKAKNEKRDLTQDEANLITDIQNKMNEQTVKAIADNALEQELILETLSENKGKINKGMLEDTVQKMNKTRDDSVTAAEETYEGVVKNLLEQRDQSKTISADEYETLKKNAEDQKNSIVTNAELARVNGLEKLGESHSKTMNTINLETGKSQSDWQNLKDKWSNITFEEKVAKVRTEVVGGGAAAAAMGVGAQLSGKSFGAKSIINSIGKGLTLPQLSTFGSNILGMNLNSGVNKSFLSQARSIPQTYNTSNDKSINLSGGITFNISGDGDSTKLTQEIIDKISRTFGLEIG